MKPDAVVKVGGSLLDWPGLPARLSAYLNERSGERLVLIVGGGAAADTVRTLDRIHRLGEERAHGLALRALDFTAQLLASLVETVDVVERETEIRRVWTHGRTPVLAARRWLEEDEARMHDRLPHTWDVTSDTIAAHVARRLGAGELVLLKSTELAGARSYDEAARAGLVDAHFPVVARHLERVVYLNLRCCSGVADPLGPFS